MQQAKRWKNNFLQALILSLLFGFFSWASAGKLSAVMMEEDKVIPVSGQEAVAKKGEQEKAETSAQSGEAGEFLPSETGLIEEQGQNKEATAERRLSWEGSLLLDHRAFARSPRNYSFKEYRLDLKAEAGTEKTRFRGDLWVRSLGFPSIRRSADLFIREKTSPLEVQLREAYVDIYGFLFPWLDLRIGRQRIAWGTADRVNPTDNLNPDDLEDIWDFGRHLGSDAVKATCYFGDVTITGVFLPSFMPASPPLPDWATAFMPPLEVQGMKIRHLDDEIILPSNNWKDSSIAGVKVATKLQGYDFSLSYVYGRDDLPLLRDIIVEDLTAQGIDVRARLVYPRMKILGMDMAGSLGGVGIWAEGAVFFPERVVGMNVFPVPGVGLIQQEAVVLRNRAYTKFVAGGDYTFPGGVYLNIQLAHGFLHERGTAELGDYFLFNLEWPLLRDKLKLIPLAGCIEVRKWKEIKDNAAFILTPSIEYHPAENTEIVAGGRIIDGRSGTSFGRIKDRDEVFLRFKYSF